MIFCRFRLHTFQYRKDAVTFLGVGCFESFQQNLGITCHVLSGHLKRVAENDILVKTSYAQRQERYKYRLTEKGLALYLILMSMANWAGE